MLDGDGGERFAGAIDVFEGLDCQADGERSIMQCGVGNNAVERSFEFANAAGLVAGDILSYRGRDGKTERVGLGAQYRQAVLVLWRLDIGQQAPLKA